MDRFSVRVKITKADAEGRFVRGFALVTDVDGEPVVDWQGDVVSIDDMREAAHEFVEKSRAGDVMHDEQKIARLTESVIIDDELAAVLGIADKRRGWWVGFEVLDADVRKRVKAGELPAFSIGGTGVRVPIKD